MTRLLALFLGIVCAAAAARGDDPPKALELLKGEWKLVSYTHANEEVKLEKSRNRVEFTTSQMILTLPPREASSPFTIDAKADPKTIDVSPVLENYVAKGIWKIENQQLIICMAIGGGERPTDFKSEKTNSIMVLERVKK